MSGPWVRKEIIGNATLYLGDCLEVMPEPPKAAEQIDMLEGSKGK